MGGEARTCAQDKRAPAYCLAVELETERDHFRRSDAMPGLAGGLVAPVRDQVPPCRLEECGVGAANRIDGDHAPTRVNRQPQLEERLFLGQQLRVRVGRLEL